MSARANEQLGAVTGLLAVTAVGLVTLAAEIGGPGELRPEHPAVWWTAYGLYVLVFLVEDRLPVPGDTALTVLVGLGLVVWWFSPEPGWVAIVLVVSAAAAASAWSPRTVAAVVGLQTAVIAVGTTLSGFALPFVVMSVLAFGTFQAFAALVVLGGRKEAEARAELAAAHAELRATTALLDRRSRDAERLRIARELHDVVGHQLTALTLELEVAGHLTDGDAGDHVRRARQTAKELLGDVRATVGRLRVEGQGLEPLLRAVLHDLPGLDVDLTVQEDATVDDDATLAVVRCVQETATNALRHAGAGHLTVRVHAGHAGVVVEVEDDGRGARQVRVGNGLAGMRERFAALGGEVTFSSAPGQGFRVRAAVPAGEPG